MTDDDAQDDDVRDDATLGADEARLQAMLEREARAYHVPPATPPRDRMWADIRARRDARRQPAGVMPIAAAPSRRRDWAHHAGWGAVAAAALIAGVGLGRLGPRAPATVTRSSASALAARPARTPPPEPPRASEPTRLATDARMPASRGAGSIRTGADNRDRAPATRGVPGVVDRTAPRAYQDVAAVHLAAAEALLVALHAPSETASSDTVVSAWAGDLLGTTRVLLDSPAARDRRTRELLQDLELVLAQIARLRPDAPADGRGVSDRGLIDQAIRQRQMLTRLRAGGA